MKQVRFTDLLSNIVDNRGRTCPTSDTGIPLIATNCVKNSALYPSFEKVRYVSEDTYKSWFRGHPQPGDLIFVTKGSPGQVCLVPDPVPFCIAQDMVAIRANPKVIYPPYLFAALRSELVQHNIHNMHVGTLIPHFKKGDFDKLFIPVPDEKAQLLIGDLYLSLSQKIDLNRRMNETLETMTRTLFKDWFVDFGPTRAKREGHEPYLPPELWELFPKKFDDEGNPVGWNKGTLGDIANLNPESWSARNAPESVEYVDLANTKWGTIERTEIHQWDAAPSRARRVLHPGDTIVGTVRPGNGSFAFIGRDGLTGSTGFAVLRPKSQTYRELVYCAATSRENIERLAHVADGGAYPAVRPDVVSESALWHGTEPLIEKFSETCAPLFDLMEKNKNESRTLTQIRDLLLPNLMSKESSVFRAESSL